MERLQENVCDSSGIFDSVSKRFARDAQTTRGGSRYQYIIAVVAPVACREHQTNPKLRVKKSSITTKHLYLIFDVLVRRSWYSVLPSLDATISCR